MRKPLFLLSLSCILSCTDTDTIYAVEYYDRVVPVCPSYETGLSIPQYMSIYSLTNLYIYLCDSDGTLKFTNGSVTYSSLSNFETYLYHVVYTDVVYTCSCDLWETDFTPIDSLIQLHQYVSISYCASTTEYYNLNGVCINE